MSKPAWGGVGAWALEAERAEAEERDRVEANRLIAGQTDESFPSLTESSKTKKNKKITVSLSEFHSGGPRGSVFEPKGITHDDMSRLPTGPRERTAEELENSRLGGGFRSYGYNLGGGGGAGPPRRRSEFGTDDDSRRGSSIPRSSDPDLPSRADEADNWASAKKFTPSLNSGRQDFGSLGSGGSSKADEVDNWSLGKKSTAPPPLSRNPGFGSGFRDSVSSGADTDRWSRGTGSFPSNGERQRPRLVLDPPKRDPGTQQEMVRSRPNPFGVARPREEVLAEKGMDWKKMEDEIEAKKVTRPTSSHSSRPSSAQSSRPESPISQMHGERATLKPKPKANPFGDAKPREVLLEEKGMDWRKLDEDREHRRADRSATDEEKQLKEDVDHLNTELAIKTESKAKPDSSHISTEQLRTLQEPVKEREKELDRVTRDWNDKIYIGQKASVDVRPGSGSGRASLSADRPPSQSAIPEDTKNIEFVKAPRLRETSDSWINPDDDRLVLPRNRDSGFVVSGNMGRPKSRERW